MKRVVIAGASIAGLSVARELRKSGFEGVIELVDEEPEAPYRRPSVSKEVLTGRHTAQDVTTPWPDQLELERTPGVRLTGLNLDARTLTGRDGAATVTLPFDGLVLATGSVARPSPYDGKLDGVLTLRSLADSLALRSALNRARRVVIIGGGFIGLEVASSARALGLDVAVVEVAEIPLQHALGAALGARVAALHRAHGVELICGASVERIDGIGAVEGVALADGRRFDADLVLVAVGSAPCVDWLRDSPLDLSNGIKCDAGCAVVGAQRVVAAGDVANWFNPLYGCQMRVEHWTNAIEQGTYAARRLLGVATSGGFSSAPYFWSDQFGVKIQSVGTSRQADEVRVVEDDGDRLVVAYGRDGRLAGVAGIDAGNAVLRSRKQVEARIPMASLTPAVMAAAR